MGEEAGDLGFTWRATARGDVLVRLHGRLVAALRGAAARDLLASLEGAGPEEQQQLLARATGDYRRGNERLARAHPRNR